MRVLDKGFTQEACQQMARILYEETGVGAVAITDREKLLAFIGIGEDHHLPGTAINSAHTFKAIQHNEVVCADGNLIPYSCNLHPQCRLGSSLVIPLRGEEGRWWHHQALRAQAQVLLLHQPHPWEDRPAALRPDPGQQVQRAEAAAGPVRRSSCCRRRSTRTFCSTPSTPGGGDPARPEDARTLVHHLSTFFRKNLKRQGDEVTLADELEHVNAYLHIEQAPSPST